MTELLEKAIIEAKRLPDFEQDAIATLILKEMQDDAQWDNAFDKSQNLLAKLASEALDEDNQGMTKYFDPNQL